MKQLIVVTSDSKCSVSFMLCIDVEDHPVCDQQEAGELCVCFAELALMAQSIVHFPVLFFRDCNFLFERDIHVQHFQMFSFIQNICNIYM